MSQTAIDTQKIQEALNQLQDVHSKLRKAIDDAEAAANLVRVAWESSEAAPTFHRGLSELIAKGPDLINDTWSMIQYLQDGIADHQKADAKLTSGAPTQSTGKP